MMPPEEARRILVQAELICSEEDVTAAVDRIAVEISAQLADANPLVLAVMSGAVVFAGRLLPKLLFPLEFDFLQVARYGAATAGGTLRWLVEPRASVAGRTVLVLDDVLDEGITLAAICTRLLAQGARECRTAVLVEKDLGRDKPITADFIGLQLPNRFLFGCGMDIKGAWRNLPAIYAQP